MKLLLVGSGGALGALARYLFTSTIFRLFGPSFPWGTLTVNIVGSFIMGLVVMLFALRLSPLAGIQSFVITGFLGGFTTFSAFSLDAASLFERSGAVPALGYVAASMLGSLAAIAVGIAVGRSVF